MEDGSQKRMSTTLDNYGMTGAVIMRKLRTPIHSLCARGRRSDHGTSIKHQTVYSLATVCYPMDQEGATSLPASITPPPSIFSLFHLFVFQKVLMRCGRNLHQRQRQVTPYSVSLLFSAGPGDMQVICNWAMPLVVTAIVQR